MFIKSILLVASSLCSLSVATDNLVARATCNADNCARAATGTRGIGQPSRLAECSSYQTSTATYVVSAAIITFSASPVPAFAASQCTRPGSYASACNCAGVPASATTILLYPTDTPCGGGRPGRFTYLCGYGPNPETNKGVAQNLNGAGSGSYENCAAACLPRPRCFSFLYNAISRSCALYEYATRADEDTRSNVQRGEPQDIYAYLN